MEPDFRKLISDKVKSTESIKIEWDREGAWNKIKHSQKPGRQWFYYAAAAVSLIMMMSLYEYASRNNLQKNISKVEVKMKAVEDLLTCSPEILNAIETPCMAAPQDITESKIRNIKGTKQSEVLIVNNRINQGNLNVSYQDTISTTQQWATTLELIAPDSIETEKHVKPVLGIVPTSDGALAVVKHKRIRFRFLRNTRDELSRESVYENNLVVARIK